MAEDRAINQESKVTVFYLEMHQRSQLRESVGPEPMQLKQILPSDFHINRKMYLAVGADWNWRDKADWTDQQWSDFAGSLQTWIAYVETELAGYFELLPQTAGNVEIAHFGLLPEFVGKGFGKSLLTQAVKTAWDLPCCERVWLHTCSDDHRHALQNYLDRGFRLFRTD